jgi:hypothetical protein
MTSICEIMEVTIRQHEGCWEAKIGDRVVTGSPPVLAAARALLEMGIDPNCMLIIRRANAFSSLLRGRLGTVAKVAETDARHRVECPIAA